MNWKLLPKEITDLPQWVCVRDRSKIPMMATEYKAASATNPQTWSDFDTACESVKVGNYSYIGFVFNNNGIVGIDIDCGYDEDGFLSDTALDIISKADSYTEYSKSGRGFHILLRGELPFKGKNNQAGVEIYRDARYFISTGDVFDNRTVIKENQQVIDYVVEKYFPESLKESSNPNQTGVTYKPEVKLETNNGRVKIITVYPEIPQGCRNLSLLSLAGQLHSQNKSKEKIYQELLKCNEVACKPPLSIAEIQRIYTSAMKYERS